MPEDTVTSARPLPVDRRELLLAARQHLLSAESMMKMPGFSLFAISGAARTPIVEAIEGLYRASRPLETVNGRAADLDLLSQLIESHRSIVRFLVALDDNSSSAPDLRVVEAIRHRADAFDAAVLRAAHDQLSELCKALPPRQG